MENENEKPGSRWTPELIIQAFKELITAIFGVLILVFTLVLAKKTFGFVNNPEQVARAKDILLLLLGLAGVVVGYYFGRVPADARASQAQEKAELAVTHAGLVDASAREALDKIEKTLARQQAGSGFRPEKGSVSAESDIIAELLEIRNNLHDLTALGKNR
jgi:hypothetical protein